MHFDFFKRINADTVNNVMMMQPTVLEVYGRVYTQITNATADCSPPPPLDNWKKGM